MCRHLAYLGPPVRLAALLYEPPHALLRQSWAPRRQHHGGTVNADGFGVGWYADADPIPARYRRAVPMWADPSFADVARVTRTRALLAAIRNGTVGMALDEAAVAPYRDGHWLFSHNGAVDGWPDSVHELAATLPAGALLDQEARCDSAFVWLLVRERLRAGTPAGEALAQTVRAVAEHTPARLNLLLTDGALVAATTWGHSLAYRWEPGALVVASEPYDDSPDWTDVPDGALFVGTADGVSITPLEAS